MIFFLQFWSFDRCMSIRCIRNIREKKKQRKTLCLRNPSNVCGYSQSYRVAREILNKYGTRTCTGTTTRKYLKRYKSDLYDRYTLFLFSFLLLLLLLPFHTKHFLLQFDTALRKWIPITWKHTSRILFSYKKKNLYSKPFEKKIQEIMDSPTDF